MTIYFVTSTGTEIGKTYVTCALIDALVKRDAAVDAIKPVVSGFEAATAKESDTGLILRALGLQIDKPRVDEISPWRFHAALSPDMAAAREGRRITLDEVSSYCRAAETPETVLLIEGAGGLMSPLGADFTNLDLIAALDAQPILVAGTYLGTISHVLTACEALNARGREAWGLVLSESQHSPVTPAETAESIGRFSRAPIYLLPRGATAPDDLVEALLG